MTTILIDLGQGDRGEQRKQALLDLAESKGHEWGGKPSIGRLIVAIADEQIDKGRTKMTNKCGIGFCSHGYTSARVAECREEAGPDWNGQCPSQNGRRVEDVKTVEVHCEDCTRNGCTMDRFQFALWNGQCAYSERVN